MAGLWHMRQAHAAVAQPSSLTTYKRVNGEVVKKLSQRDNEIGDFTAKMQKETHSNMVTESRLQLNNGEHLPKTANEDDEANVDISANSF